jgi:hypothetical protein
MGGKSPDDGLPCPTPELPPTAPEFCDANPCACQEAFCDDPQLTGSDGTLARALSIESLSSCDTGPVEVYGTIALPQPVATDAERIYYFVEDLTTYDLSVASMPKSGGVETVLGMLSSSGSHLSIALDGGAIYAGGGTVLTLPKSGGVARKLTYGNAVLVRGGFLYFASGRGFGRWSDARGVEWLFQWCPSYPYAGALDLPALVVADEEFAYLPFPMLVRMRLDGGPYEPIDDVDAIYGMALADGRVFVSDGRTNTVRSIRPGTQETYVLARFERGPRGLAADAEHLYVQAMGAPNGHDNRPQVLLRMALDGSDACVLDGEGGYGPPWLDGDYVYYSGAGVRRVRK